MTDYPHVRWLSIKASVLRRAILRVRKLTDDWPAECIAVALVPAVYRRLAVLNKPFGTVPHITFHPGKPHIGFTPEQNEQVGRDKAWAQYVGWTLVYGDYGIWNTQAETWYSHSASTCWNGCSRNLHVVGFVEHLRGAVVRLMEGDHRIEGYLTAMAERRVRLIDDISTQTVQAASKEVVWQPLPLL